MPCGMGKARSAISLPFDQFELGHVSLNHAVIDPPGETSSCEWKKRSTAAAKHTF